MDPTAALTIAAFATYSTIGSTVVAIMALGMSIWTAWIQRQHNKLSVRPLPEIQLRDMNGQVRVKLINNGTGPLIIKSLEVLDGKKIVGRALIQLMPSGGHGWNFFVDIIDGRSIAPNGEITLIDLEYDPHNKAELDFATSTRAALSCLGIRIHYKSIYGNNLPSHQRDLAWFGRLL
jgi:hypothetical protein